MVDYEKFWTLIKIGKWRSEAIQLQFYGRVRELMLLTIFGYLIIVLYFAVIPKFAPTFPSDFDFFTPVSTIWGFVITFIGLTIGFTNYFVYERTKPEIISYFGKIEYKNTKTLVTFCNLGETAVIRNISLFAVKEKKKLLRSSIPILDIACSVPLFQGWRIIKNGEVAGVLEKTIKLAIAEINHRIKNEKDKNELDLCIMAFDEEFIIREQEKSFNNTMVAGCKLGKYSELAQYAEGKKDGFPVYDRIIRLYENDLKNLASGKSAHAIIIDECPPNVVDMDFEILEKLDSIEKILKKGLKKDK